VKCYWQEGDGPWVKGYFYTFRGLTEMTFRRETPAGFQDAIVMTAGPPEIEVCDKILRITGFVRQGTENNYKLVTVDVSPGWVKPRKG
jgi:hypothetical protein